MCRVAQGTDTPRQLIANTFEVVAGGGRELCMELTFYPAMAKVQARTGQVSERDGAGSLSPGSLNGLCLEVHGY